MSGFNIEYAISARDSLTPVLRKIQAEVKRLESSMRGLVKPIKMTADTKQVEAAVKRVQGMKFTIKGDVHAATGGLNKTTAQPQQVGGGGGMGGAIVSRAGMAAAAGVATAGIAVKEMVGLAMDLETAQLGLRKAFNLSSDEIKPYAKELRDLSSNLGVAQNDVTTLATQYAKADGSLDPAGLKEITRLTIASSKAWEVSSESVQDAFGLMKAIYGQNTAELTHTANSVDLLGDKFGVLNEGYLTDFITQGGAIAKSMGMTSGGMLAYGAAAGEMKIEAGAAANALKILNASMSDKGSAGALAKIGVDFKTLQTLNPEQKIGQILTALNAYQGADKGMIASDIIGKHYDDTLLQLAISSDKYAQALTLTGDEAQSSGRVMKALGMESETTKGQIDRARETVKNFGASIGDSVNLALGSFIGWMRGGTAGVSLFKGSLLALAAVAAMIFAPWLFFVGVAVAVGVALKQVWDKSTALQGSLSELWGVISGAFAPLSGLLDGLFGVSDAGSSMDKVFVGIGAAISVLISGVATLIDGFVSLVTIGLQLMKLDFSGVADTAKGFASRFMGRGNKLEANVKADWAATNAPSPIAAKAAQTGAVKQAAGVTPTAAAGGVQAATIQQQAATTAQAAATQNQGTAATETAASVVNAQSALTQQQAATTQASVGAQFTAAASQMMAAAQAMMVATSRPLTVNVAGGAGMGDQGR